MNLIFDSKRFSLAVKQKRGDVGLRAIGKEVGVSPATLSRVENKKEPDITSMAKICLWLDLPMDNFFKPKK